MLMRENLKGLYAITDTALLGEQLLDAVVDAIDGGARVIQYRDKSKDALQKTMQARALAALCKIKHCTFVINDDIDLALAVNADGVHLGRDDVKYTRARQLLGSQRLIGISCYDSITHAQAAASAGADYVAFGSFFASQAKPNAVRADIALIADAKRSLKVPIVAIGGITLTNAAPLVTQGVDMVAVIHGLFAQTDVRKTAQSFTQLFTESR